MNNAKTISGGLYLVVDPSIEGVAEKVKCALDGGVDVLQIWDHWDQQNEPSRIIDELLDCCVPFQVPVLINNSPELMVRHSLHGVHYDDWRKAKEHRILYPGDSLVGITIGDNDPDLESILSVRPDYLSFCALFPSASAGSCQIISTETIRKVRAHTQIPLFGSGGVEPGNVHVCLGHGLDGVAVVSGILSQEDPLWATRQYKHAINFYTRYAY